MRNPVTHNNDEGQSEVHLRNSLAAVGSGLKFVVQDHSLHFGHVQKMCRTPLPPFMVLRLKLYLKQIIYTKSLYVLQIGTYI